MTEFLTRRERREAERNGVVVPAAAAPVIQQEQPVVAEVEAKLELTSTPQQFLSRRELREAERRGVKSEPQTVVEVPAVVELPQIEIEDEALASQELEEIVNSSEILLDLPPADFTGSNLLAEPSTQSIVLEVAPEAIALPIETGEIAVTGSIAVLTEPATGSITGGLDGIELDNADRQDAVTGVISIVEPISALDVINARVNVGVVPKSVLRKGWWRPWAIGAAALVMAVAAILATVTILNALGA